MLTLARNILFAAVCSGTLTAQAIACPGGVIVPYFGWDGTDCGNCIVYGSYLEYLTPPGLNHIRADGPAAGRIHENDTLVAVDGRDITTPAAWHQLRDAEPGRAVRLSLRRGRDTASATIVPSTRCAPEGPSPRAYRAGPARGATVARTLVVAGAVIEISGDPESVSYDPKTGEAVIVSGRTVVRVKPKP